MDTKEFRISNKISQYEAATLVGVPLRTYVRYENEKSYESSFKYKKIYEELASKFLLDKEHGLLSVDEIKEIAIPILENYKINFCYLFGSYAKGNPKETSDIDFLVDTDITGIKFLVIIEDLRTALHKKVDLLAFDDLRPENPIIKEILRTSIRIL